MRDKLNYSWYSIDFQIIDDGSYFNHGLFIWVFHWDKIPHLGLSLNGAYYSIAVHGNQIGEKVEKYFRLATSKNIPTFCIQLDNNSIVRNFIPLFTTPIGHEETCLFPIKTALSYQNEKVETLIDLIQLLENEQKIEKFLSLQVVEKLTLNTYNKSDVIAIIENKMNHAFRK